jgi:Mce-associated membrane protein
VEDQPADSGDLTPDADVQADSVEAADETAVAEAPAKRRRFSLRRRAKAVAPEQFSTTDPEAEVEAEPDEDKPAPRVPTGKAGRTPKPSAPVEAPDEDVILVAHRPVGKRMVIAASAAGVLFVGAAGFAAATLQPYLADRAAVDIKLDVARTAANAITTLWTYTPDNMEALPDRSARFLGGDFANEYRKYIDAIVASNKQAQVSNNTQVMGTAVESLTPTEATAIVYTNSVASSPVTKNIPSLRYLSYRLTMQRHDADWLITRMSTITSLDLTPQL